MLDPAGQTRQSQFNETAAERLREAAALLAHQNDNADRAARQMR